jgi:hypothetical protein
MHVVDEREFTTDDFAGTVTLGVWQNGNCSVVITQGNVILFDSGLIANRAQALDIYNHPALHLYYVSDVASRVAEYV